MNLKYYLKKVRREGGALGQFNFSTLEQLRGILEAAQNLKRPLILGTSERESNFLGLKEIVALVEIAKTKYRAPVFLNLDHAKDPKRIKEAIGLGYSAVHFDGSDLTLEKNLKYAKKIVEYAHKKNVLVEGELEEIKKGSLSSAEEAALFVKKTKVDSLAIAIGNRHGFYPGVKLDFERLKEIRKKTGQVFLVLHGGSGISKNDLKKAISLGIVKVNINSELRLVWKRGLVSALKGEEIKPYQILPIVQKLIQKKVEEKIKTFKTPRY